MPNKQREDFERSKQKVEVDIESLMDIKKSREKQRKRWLGIKLEYFANFFSLKLYKN